MYIGKVAFRKLSCAVLSAALSVSLACCSSDSSDKADLSAGEETGYEKSIEK